MQPINLLKGTLEENASREHCLFCPEDFYSLFPDFSIENLRMLLSRAVKSGVLERVCKGIYLYPKAGYDSSILLFKIASKLRADFFNYISFETVLSHEGLISQQPFGWITVMTSGRRGIINCGRFGSVELIHTTKPKEKIMSHLRLDLTTGMWWADTDLALQDMKHAKRAMDLVEEGWKDNACI
jgi:hypothetical protein